MLLILLHPILNRKIGDLYGMTMVVNSFSLLIGILVNYGTNQSGIKDIALAKNDKVQRAIEFYNVIFIRSFIFLLFFVLFLFAGTLNIKNYSFFLLAGTVIFAEVLNPLFLYIGMEKLSMFNIINVFIKLAVILSVILLINGPEDAVWVNFYIGLSHIIGYLILIIYAIVKFGLPFKKFNHLNFRMLLKDNIYLVSNGLSSHLQQSFMLFAIAKWGTSGWLYAYSISDKVIWSARLLIISISNAIYPKAAVIFNESQAAFIYMKQRYNRFLGVCFGLISLLIFIFAPLIIRLYTGDENQTAILFLRLMSLSPLLASLNALNIIHLLISNQNKQILKIGLFLLLLSLFLSTTAIYFNNIYYVGIYLVIVEALALIYYTYSTSQNRPQLLKAN